MNHYLIIYGAYGHSKENWFPWLSTQLSDYGQVSIPEFPTPVGQDLESWLLIAHRALDKSPPDKTYIIGHSTGAVVALRLAEKAQKPFRAIFSVCPFTRDLGLKFDILNKTFVASPFEWDKVKRGAVTIKLYAGDNDPYVPLNYSQEVANA